MRRTTFYSRWVLLALPLLLLACEFVNPENSGPSIRGRTYENPEIGVRITAPEDWMVTDKLPSGFPADLAAVTKALLYRKGTEGYLPTVRVSVAPHSGSADYGAILEDLKTQIETGSPGARIDSEGVFMVKEQKMAEVQYTAISDGDTVTTKTLVAMHTHGGHAYDLAFTCADIASEFSAQEKDFQAVLDSIELF